MNRRGRLALGAVVAVALTASLLVSPDAVLARLSWLAADPVRFGVALVLVGLVRPLFVWPTTLLAVAAGYGYGVAGAPVGLALITASAIPTYLLAKRLRRTGRDGPKGRGTDPAPGADPGSGPGGASVSDPGSGPASSTGTGRVPDGRVVRVASRVRSATGDLRGTTAARLLPIPSDLVSAGAGLAGVSAPAFVAGTALGEAPWAVAGALAGSSLSTLAAEGSLAAAVDWRLVGAAAVVAVGLLVGPAYRAATGKTGTGDASAGGVDPPTAEGVDDPDGRRGRSR
jgi:uncharacterized membrane protein YdjX (TVP38/TMEM64 family)